MSNALPMIYLVRHGETAWTLTAQHTGRTDLPLNKQGERQARELATSLAALRIDRIFSSPLQRARRTAELAMPHSLVEADEDLMEWDYGAYEGRSTVDIEVERPGWRLLRDGSPGGETLDAVGARADRVIGRIRACGDNVMLFGHREILRIFAVRWIRLAPIEGRRLLLATASLSVLGYDHDLTEPVIHAWNIRPDQFL
jgi:probable phosphoglycerate mutase